MMVFRLSYSCCFLFFFFNDTATTEIYTLSLHDALPILPARPGFPLLAPAPRRRHTRHPDRKSTRLNSSHTVISYAVFCLKKKKNIHARYRISQKEKKDHHRRNYLHGK